VAHPANGADQDPVTLRYEGPVAIVTFNRPHKHNAVNNAMENRFFSILTELHERRDIRAGILRGEGRSFSSGRDTSEIGVREQGKTHLELIEEGHAKTRQILSMPFPLIAALKGWVIGASFERALLCDLRVAADDARMTLPEVKLGMVPDSGGVSRLSQLAGPSVAADMSLTGRTMTAAEALVLGIVSKVVSHDELDGVAMEMAQTIAAAPPFAVRMARQVLSSLTAPSVIESMRQEMLIQARFTFGDWDQSHSPSATT
jgi:enoyl-CoA hydratase/carnithine racemase